MSYPPPPGISNLPAKPPASTASSTSSIARTGFSSGGFKSSGFKPAFPSAAPPTATYNAPSYPGASSTASSYGPSAPPAHYGAPATTYGAYPQAGALSSGAGSASGGYAYSSQPQGYGQYSSHAQQPPSSASYGSQSYGAAAVPPQVRNPFPRPGATGGPNASAAPYGGYHAHDNDPEMAAQIAQWQSAYTQREADPDAAPLSNVPSAPMPVAPVSDKKKTVAREGGGKKWTDDTLLEWDPSHLRLFVGNLAGETTDEALLKAFSRWGSVQKARVVRDKRTTKSKGYGFVSFSDADDFFQAAKEMNGKYIQSHPVTVKKANTEIKVTNVKERERGRNGKRNNNQNHRDKKSGSGGHGGGGASGYEANLGQVHGAGIVKPGQKTKNGLRLLG